MYLSRISDQVFVDIPKINGNSRGLNGTFVGIDGRNCKHKHSSFELSFDEAFNSAFRDNVYSHMRRKK